MSDDALREIYRLLGYRGPDPSSWTTMSALPETSLRPLAKADLMLLKRRFREDPATVLQNAGRMMGLNQPLPYDRLAEVLGEAELLFADSDKYLTYLRARQALHSSPRVSALDGDCPPEDAENKTFEPLGDPIGWLMSIANACLHPVEPRKFPAPQPGGTGFIYPMKTRDGSETVKIALVSDFGTGMYWSCRIGKLIVEAKPDYVIHLGDVYYAGRSDEVKPNLAKPFADLCEHARVFVMNGNHEMMSGGVPLLDYIDAKREAHPGMQEQEGTFFSIRSDKYEIIAIDTDYDTKNEGDIAFPDVQVAWLEQRLEEAATAKRTVILLSQHEPYGFGESGEKKLFADVQDLVGKLQLANQGLDIKIDYWFWGDEHYCALFGPRGIPKDRFPFVGACIGHGGHPVYRDMEGLFIGTLQRCRRHNEGHKAAPLIWADTSPRFDDGRRPRIGNAGFCLLELSPTGVQMTFRDWRGRDQYIWPSAPPPIACSES